MGRRCRVWSFCTSHRGRGSVPTRGANPFSCYMGRSRTLKILSFSPGKLGGTVLRCSGVPLAVLGALRDALRSLGPGTGDQPKPVRDLVADL